MLQKLFSHSFILRLSICKTVSSFSQGRESGELMISVVHLLSRERAWRATYPTKWIIQNGIAISFNNNQFKEKLHHK